MTRGAAFRVFPVVVSIALASPAEAVSCEEITFEEVPYSICEVAGDEDLRLWLRDDAGEILGDFSAIEAELGESRLSFAMNAGMFHEDRQPVGLYIEGGEEITPASDGGGYGNFGLLPNGILCISDGGVRVWESSAWAEQSPDCRFATQSGPMLVIGGALHPALMSDSTSRFIRNGVGTSADGKRAVFAISNRPVNFHSFARLFRDELDLPDALFLDANVSRLHAPELGRSDSGGRMGPIVGVVDGPETAR